MPYSNKRSYKNDAYDTASYDINYSNSLASSHKADMHVLKNEVDILKDMLCALCTEIHDTKDFTTITDNAVINGDCSNIREWFKDHINEDIDLLVKDGLSEKASNHKKDLFERLETIRKLKELEYVSK